MAIENCTCAAPEDGKWANVHTQGCDVFKSGDILERLSDLHKQATTERSHFYVGALVTEAMQEISELRLRLAGREVQS